MSTAARTTAPLPAAAQRKPVSMAGLLARFAGAGLLVSVILAVLLAVLSRQAGTDQAEQAARQVTWLTGKGIVEPRLTPAVLAGDPAALEQFNAAMNEYVIQGSLVRVKLWDETGRVVYSNESRLIGDTFPLGAEEQQALTSGGTNSEISDLSKPENQYEADFGSLLEVYTGMTGPAGGPLLFEAYFLYDSVTEAGQAQWRTFAPAALGALLVLELVQIPFAWSLARRVQRQQQDAERLLRQAIDASDDERRRIAADLHDGVVQQLAGLTFTLDAARLGVPNAARDRELLAEAAAQLRRTTGEMRSLLVDIYPPDLATEGLGAALVELAGTVERDGVHVDLDVDEADGLPLPASSVLFRAAQEILRNVMTHSRARAVSVAVRRDGGSATLVIDDDGRGFDEAELPERQRAGHVGLRSLGDLVRDSGGRLTVRSAPGQGTRVDVEVPA